MRIVLKYESNLHAQELELEEFCASSLLVHDATYVIDLLLPYIIIIIIIIIHEVRYTSKMSRNVNNIITICATYLFLYIFSYSFPIL